MNTYNLGGHSGCQIFLIEEDDGRVYVRKISKDKEYNSRLKIQSEKQANFSGEPIRAPKVFQQGYTDEGLFYFDMEYVQGVTLAEYIKNMEIGKVRGLVEALVSSLVPQRKVSVSEEQEKEVRDIFEKKFADLHEKLYGKNEIINEALALLETHDWSRLISLQVPWRYDFGKYYCQK